MQENTFAQLLYIFFLLLCLIFKIKFNFKTVRAKSVRLINGCVRVSARFQWRIQKQPKHLGVVLSTSLTPPPPWWESDNALGYYSRAECSSGYSLHVRRPNLPWGRLTHLRRRPLLPVPLSRVKVGALPKWWYVTSSPLTLALFQKTRRRSQPSVTPLLPQRQRYLTVALF